MDVGVFNLVRAALGSLAASTDLFSSRDRLVMVLGGRCSPYRTHQGVTFHETPREDVQGTLVANRRFVAVLHEASPSPASSYVPPLPEAPAGLEWVGGAVPSLMLAGLVGPLTDIGWPFGQHPLVWVQVLRRRLARWDGSVPVWQNTPGGLPPWWPIKDEGTYPIVPEVFRAVVCSDEPLQAIGYPGAHSYSPLRAGATSAYETLPGGGFRCVFCNAPDPAPATDTPTE